MPRTRPYNFQPYTDPISSNSRPQIQKFYFFIISCFLDHVTILFLLLRTWERIVVEVMINQCVVLSTIGCLSNSCASCLYRLRTRRNVLLAIGGVWVGMAIVNTPILTAYHSTLIGSDTWHACVPVTIATARHIFIAFFICDYLLPLTIIGFISISIYRHITVHGMTSAANQNANRYIGL